MKRVLLLPIIAMVLLAAATPAASPEVVGGLSFQPLAVVPTLSPSDAAAVVTFVRYVEQTQLSTYLASLGYPIPDRTLWALLHECEEGSEWYANGGNANDSAGQTFQGGLGMSVDATRMGVQAAAARGVILPASALDQTPDQQMQTAQAFFDANGWGWACAQYQP